MMPGAGQPRSSGDFHCHSARSDGTLAPADLVDLAAANGVRTLALTDHDTVDGIEEARLAAARHPGMRLIPGVELSCDVPGTEVHVLGLFVRTEDPAFREAIDHMRFTRIDRGRRITEALADLGAPVSWTRVQEIAADASIGRPHIARALIEAGHVADVDGAFERYLANDSPAYVPRERVEPEAAVDLIRNAGGVAVFAHPPFSDDHEAIAKRLAAAGLFGLEVYYRDYEPAQVAALLELAAALGLIPSGGSDYHGLPRRREVEPGCFAFPEEAVERLLDEASAQGCRIPEAVA
jgi:3',5'-nucleoside bisphosphate phosphatase